MNKAGKFLVLLICVALLSVALFSSFAAAASYTWSDATVPVVASGDTVTISGSPSGTLVVPAGATVTIDGTVTGAVGGLTLDIGTGATVQWNAILQGTATTYLLNVRGSGTLSVGPCTLLNSGSGGAINVLGAGTTVQAQGGAVIQSNTGGNSILVSADNVTLNLQAGSTIESLASNGNAAIQVGSGSNNNLQGTVINVNGANVISTGSGYAINDGAGTGTVSNNTKININGGTVSADTACAIHSTGTDSLTTVNGGVISNAAGNNANPTIYMNAGTLTNVVINGGTVQSRSNAGYTIQTNGNMSVNGGLVTAINGRAINLVGMNSTATLSGGVVQTTGTGTAISTATTNVDTVANASVVVLGTAQVTAFGSGTAINVTGANSTVTVGDSAQVSSASGYAINATGATSFVSINGMCQVWTMRAGNAIRSAGTVTLSSGFVFAYGATAAAVINAPTIAVPGGSQVVVVAWDQAAGHTQYVAGSATSSNPDLSITLNGSNSNLWWYKHPSLGSGINYANGTNASFFPLPVNVVQDYGLILDVTTGNVYANLDGTGVPDGGVTNIQVYPSSVTWNWNSLTQTLSLNGFSWKTSAPVALTIANGSAIIDLTGTNTLMSFNAQTPTPQGLSAGIATDAGLATTGSGVLEAAGSFTTAALPSQGIAAANLTFNSGTIIAAGATSAIQTASFANNALAYTYWTNSATADPGGAGTAFATGAAAPHATPFAYSNAYGFVKIASGPLCVVSDGAVSGVADSALSVQTATISLYDVNVAAALTGADASSWFATLPPGVTVSATAAAGASSITLTFGGTPVAGSTDIFDITIPGASLSSGSDVAVIYNPNAHFQIDGVYDLFVVTGTGGSVSGTPSGRYIDGVAVLVTATPDAGYYFTGWTITGTSIIGGTTANPAIFEMPTTTVVLTANFQADGSPENGSGDGAAGTDGGGSGSPATGDSNRLLSWLTMLVASLLVITIVLSEHTRRHSPQS